MAALHKAICLAVLIAAAVFVAPAAEAAISCGTVAGALSGCIPYVTNRGPLGKCCSGVTGLYGQARTTADRQMVCNCLKNLAKNVGGINMGKAAGLPKQCNVNIPYQISPSTDCNKVR